MALLVAGELSWQLGPFSRPSVLHDQSASFALQGLPGLQTALLVGVVTLMYLAGWLYSRHLPERWRPGAYDLVGNSHQWMHALVSASPLLNLTTAAVLGMCRHSLVGQPGSQAADDQSALWSLYNCVPVVGYSNRHILYHSSGAGGRRIHHAVNRK